MTQPSGVHVVMHPAVADRLARLRDRDTPTPVFRTLLEELGTFVGYEASRELPLEDVPVTTPVTRAIAQRIATRPVVAPILRAGLGLLPGFLRVIDDAVVAHLGFYRDPATLQPVPYYANVPEDLAARHIFVLDPMLATGNSGAAAISALESRGASAVTFVCLIAAPEGIRRLREAHPHVRIVTAAIDERLNEHGYIVPGLGDAGDRMFGSTSSVPVSVRPT
ncbi:MAG TPA: uracil phosphoribosyltransferase [Candidatus Baltobacteraceae bacterium]|jgi:uracil phosphoribosyltransferase|nr:uracil phosphoribosyltransferase [Candidatus Baltobacteraceae bacterium]